MVFRLAINGVELLIFNSAQEVEWIFTTDMGNR